MSPQAEERQAQRAKAAATTKLSRQRENALMSPAERQAQRAKAAATAKLSRQRRNALMSPAERQAQRAKAAAAAKLYRQHKNALTEKPQIATLSPETEESVGVEESCDYKIPVATTHPIQQARKHDQERIMQVDSNPNAYRAAVCVLCDRLIIGCESIHKITVESLRSQKNRISVKSYEDYHEVNLKDKHVNLNQGRGNGTLCKCLRVKLRKDGRERRWKNWDGKKVWTVTVDDVEWMEFENYPTPSGTKARTFRLKPQEFSATIKFPLTDTETFATTVGNAKVKQVPVNSNIATTGHKLQGMSKDVLIINDWNYRCANWVYVVLSRVRTLAGLYLMKPFSLDLERSFNVPQSLIRFEQRLKDNKERPILNLLGYQTIPDDVQL